MICTCRIRQYQIWFCSLFFFSSYKNIFINCHFALWQTHVVLRFDEKVIGWKEIIKSRLEINDYCVRQHHTAILYSKENPTSHSHFPAIMRGRKKIWNRERKPMKNWKERKPMKNWKRKKNQHFDKFYQIIPKNECLKWQEEKKCCELIKPPNKWQ